MPVGYRSSSTSGSTPSQGTSVSTPVPAGAAAGDVALYAIFQWEAANPTVTWPTGFGQILQVVNGNLKLKVARKRLTGADSGSYVASWTGAQYRLGQCMLITGAISTGEPVEVFDTATAVSDNDVPATDVTTATAAFLAHFIYNDGEANFAANQTTPPTGFTEVQDNQFLHSNYLIPGSTGLHSASGGVLSALVDAICVALVAVKPEPSAGGITGTISANIPAMTASISGQSSTDGTVSASLPAMTASLGGVSTATGVVSGSLPSVAMSIDGSSSIGGTVASQLPAIGMTIDGGARATGEVDIQIPGISAALDLQSVSSGSISASLPAVTLVADMDATVEGLLDAVLPAIQASIDGEVIPGAGQVNIVLPVMTAAIDGSAYSSAQIDALIPAMTSDVDVVLVDEGIVALSLPSLVAGIDGESYARALLSTLLPALAMDVQVNVHEPGPTPEYDAIEEPVSSLRRNTASSHVGNRARSSIRANNAEADLS